MAVGYFPAAAAAAVVVERPGAGLVQYAEPPPTFGGKHGSTVSLTCQPVVLLN